MLFREALHPMPVFFQPFSPCSPQRSFGCREVPMEVILLKPPTREAVPFGHQRVPLRRRPCVKRQNMVPEKDMLSGGASNNTRRHSAPSHLDKEQQKDKCKGLEVKNKNTAALEVMTKEPKSWSASIDMVGFSPKDVRVTSNESGFFVDAVSETSGRGFVTRMRKRRTVPTPPGVEKSKVRVVLRKDGSLYFAENPEQVCDTDATRSKQKEHECIYNVNDTDATRPRQKQEDSHCASDASCDSYASASPTDKNKESVTEKVSSVSKDTSPSSQETPSVEENPKNTEPSIKSADTIEKSIKTSRSDVEMTTTENTVEKYSEQQEITEAVEQSLRKDVADKPEEEITVMVDSDCNKVTDDQANSADNANEYDISKEEEDHQVDGSLNKNVNIDIDDTEVNVASETSSVACDHEIAEILDQAPEITDKLENANDSLEELKEEDRILVEAKEAPFHVSLDVSGFDPSDIKIKVVDRQVTVQAEGRQDRDGITLFQQLSRSFLLPPGVEANSVRSALTSEGKLTVFGKEETSKEKVVPVQRVD